MENFLKKYHPETLNRKPVPLDVDKSLEVSLFLSHGYKEDLITCFDNLIIEARMRPMERTVQITQTCYNKIAVDDGHARFNVVHEASHVILHAYLVKGARFTEGEEYPIIRSCNLIPQKIIPFSINWRYLGFNLKWAFLRFLHLSL